MSETGNDNTDTNKGVDKDRPLYVISVAAELVDMHPQTLRLYERKGLIEPSRSSGKTRLYSQRDIEHLREIRRLTQELGVNLAGVEEIIRLRRELDELQDQMESRIDTLQDSLTEKLVVYRNQKALAQNNLQGDEAGNVEDNEVEPSDAEASEESSRYFLACFTRPPCVDGASQAYVLQRIPIDSASQFAQSAQYN
jgi:MerR family transcriptional regulator/heat shock protein HspR